MSFPVPGFINGAAVMAGVAVFCGVPSVAVTASAAGVWVSVQAVASTVAPGQAARFIIQISPASVLDEATVQISVSSSGRPGFPVPTFTSCADGYGTQTCTVGLLQAGQATELQAQTVAPGSAPAGDRVTLSATVSWAVLGIIGAGSATGAATASVAGAPPPPVRTPPVRTPPPSPPPHSPPPRSPPPPGGRHPGPPSPGGRHSGSPSPDARSGGRPQGYRAGGRPAAGGPGAAGTRLGARLGTLTLRRMPLPGAEGGGASVSPAGLFPAIHPSPLPAGPRGSRRAKAVPAPGRYRATAVADTVPLTWRQLSAQVAGLIALAAGILIAVVLVPLRRRWARRDSPAAGGQGATDDV
jgi:hypothetical protein